MRALLCAAVLIAGCGSSNNKGEGATCFSAQECASGLLCDYGKTPHVCAKMDSVLREDMSAEPPDMATPADLFGADLLGVDFTVAIPPDLKQVQMQDMVPPVMDLSGPD